MGSCATETVGLIKSFPLLQYRIIKDADAYENEFLIHLEHFKAATALYTDTFQQDDPLYHELILFIAHVIFVEQYYITSSFCF